VSAGRMHRVRDHLELLPIAELCCLAEGSTPMAYGREGQSLSIVLKHLLLFRLPLKAVKV